MKIITTPGILLGTAILIMELGAPMMKADTVYTYTGKDFNEFIGAPYTASDSITGSFTTSVPLGDSIHENVISLVSTYSFNDGVQTLNNFNATSVVDFDVETDATGGIIAWEIEVQIPSTNDVIFTAGNDPGSEDSTTNGVGGGANTTPGTWAITTTSSVPEPSGGILTSTALLALALLARKRKSQAHHHR